MSVPEALTVTAPAEVTRQISKGDLVAVMTAEHGFVMFEVTKRVRSLAGTFTGRPMNWPNAPEQEVAYVVDFG